VGRLALPLLASAALAALLLPVQASALTREPQPKLARQFVVAEASGRVFVKPPGAAKFSRVTERRTIPVGTTVNATKGHAKLVAGLGGERRARGTFWAGAFIATQDRDTKQIDLELTGGNLSDCDNARASALSRRARRRLKAKATGPFRSVGRHTAGTVRGTKWVTEDRCETTVIETKEGEVDAAVGAATLPVDPGDVLEVRCDPPLSAGLPFRYCIATLNDPANNVLAVGLGTAIHEGDYTICISAPNGRILCRTLALPPPEPDTNFRISVLGCIPDGGKGEYSVTWQWQGRILGTLLVDVPNPKPAGEGYCLVTSDEIPSG
jgi:hypothetical protein